MLTRTIFLFFDTHLGGIMKIRVLGNFKKYLAVFEMKWQRESRSIDLSKIFGKSTYSTWGWQILCYLQRLIEPKAQNMALLKLIKKGNKSTWFLTFPLFILDVEEIHRTVAFDCNSALACKFRKHVKIFKSWKFESWIRKRQKIVLRINWV